MSERNYWTGRPIGRRAALRGAGIGLAGLAGAALVGCGGGDGDATPAGTAAGTAPAGGSVAADPSTTKVPADQVRVAPGSYEGSIPPTAAEQNPLVNGRYGGTLVARYLDPPHMDFNRTLSCTVNTTMDYTKNKLTRAKFGAQANPLQIDIEPDLAESWEVSPDGTQFTFHLQQGVKFHNVEPTNGRTLTSEDVKLSYERYMAGGTQKDVFSEVASMELPDDNTIVIKLTQPLVDFPRNIAAWSHIDAKEMVGDLDFLGEHAIGTGPFVQEEWTKKERSVFVKNADYFEEGLPFLDKVIGQVMNDSAAIRAAFLTENIFDWGARDRDDAEQMVGQVSDAVHLQYERGQGANSNVFRFQMSNPVLQDERVRRAINMSIDRAEYSLAEGWGGGGFSTPSIAYQFLFDKRPSLEEQGPWFQHDLAQASQLMQAAGYTEDQPLSFEMTSWYLSHNYQFLDLVLPRINELPELDIKYREVDNPTAVVLLNERNFEWATGMTFGPPAYSVDQMVFPFYHSQGGLNFGNINDPELDKLVVAQRSEFDPEGQKEIWKNIWNMQLDQIWDVFLPQNPQPNGLWHNYMMGYRPHGIGSFTCYGNGQMRGVWLDEGAPDLAVMPGFIGDDLV